MVDSLLVALCVVLVCSIGLPSSEAQEEEEADLVVPDALGKDCAWERKLDYRKPSTYMFSETLSRVTEQTCKQKCNESVVCNYANYNNYTRKCDLVPRRLFHTSFNTGFTRRRDKWVMNAKNCPVEKFVERTDDPEELVMCRMQRTEQRLDKAYIYQFTKYGIASRDEAEYFCRTDPVCQGISYKTDYKYYSFYWLFYYRIAFVNETVQLPAERWNRKATAQQRADLFLSSIKNCTTPASECLFTSYKMKVLTGVPYETTASSIFECEQRCERNATCYGAVATESGWRRNRGCNLYNKNSTGEMIPYARTYRYSRTFLKNDC